MDTDSTLPHWAYSARLDDGLFAAAYDHVSAPRRALLKTCIARLYAWYGPAAVSGERSRLRWSQGFTSLQSRSPRHRCLVVFGSGVGPAALLAALMPARALGVGEVVAAYTGEGDPSDGVLVALELAGQELVVRADADGLAELVLAHEGPQGCVMFPGGESQVPKERVPTWSGPGKRRLGVWTDASDPVDLEALAFAHPEADITVMGEGAETSGSFDDLLQGAHHGLVVPNAMTRRAMDHACLTLTPGHEGCWLYPGLDRHFFSMHTVAWADMETSEDR